ncbi:MULTISPECIES: tetratricopeptide repeat protein [Leptospira]|uniref:Tetratricopeptide repeat protein n=1 Tax=Leptospira limi TaxID=2950023 RepID=A0ABT3M222_9LEPT|nr:MULTISPECIES: tetratricopeptide repeat protein [Leptospira]MCW7464018.1 hypothetical protein [Leptospira limi]TGK92487.1 hypothetical protein EHQ34_17875 [Leptospira levettii]
MYKIITFLIIVLLNYSCSEKEKSTLQKEAEKAFVFGDLQNSEIILNKILKEDPNDQHAIFLKTKILLYSGRIIDAKKVYDELGDEFQNKTESMLLLARINLALNQNQIETIDKLSSLLETNPVHLDALLLRGKFYEASNKIPEAIRDYQTIIQQSDKIKIAHSSLASIYSKAGITEKAKSHLEYAKNIEPQRQIGKKNDK